MKRAAEKAWSKEYLGMAERRVSEARRAFDRRRDRETMNELLNAIHELRDVAHFYCVTRLRGEPMPPPTEEVQHIM